MRIAFTTVVLLLLALGVVLPCSAMDPPAWAYPVNPPDFKPAPDDGSIRHVPDSTAGYTLTELRNLNAAPDWHPGDHPKMPTVVAEGRKPDVFACGVCHRADGPGGPENASIAGLPYAYIVQAMADYKSGDRSTAVPKRSPQALMIRTAKAITDDEIRAAATYFASLKPRANLRVVETDSVPATYVAGWFLAENKAGEREALGSRIIEVPEDLDRFESRDSHARFIAYVPEGSIKRGASLVKGELPARAPACAACHGRDLRGADAVPSISGRSPSFVVRQLYEFQAGIRGGERAQPMKEAVANMGIEEMIAIAAYLASRNP